ncbi:MAG: hypothetical protein ABH826_02970 [Patescibacteria group bacterium]
MNNQLIKTSSILLILSAIGMIVSVFIFSAFGFGLLITARLLLLIGFILVLFKK